MRKKGATKWVGAGVLSLMALLPLVLGCETTHHQTTTQWTPGGNLQHADYQRNGEVISELDRYFRGVVIEGEGMIENSNEGLARTAATSLAVRELAGKVQTRVRANTAIYNNKDVRDIVETRVDALVNNYEIDTAAYDPNSTKYRVRVRITGEQIAREIQQWLTGPAQR
jgi:hypothetical protein